MSTDTPRSTHVEYQTLALFIDDMIDTKIREQLGIQKTPEEETGNSMIFGNFMKDQWDLRAPNCLQSLVSTIVHYKDLITIATAIITMLVPAIITAGTYKEGNSTLDHILDILLWNKESDISEKSACVCITQVSLLIFVTLNDTFNNEIFFNRERLVIYSRGLLMATVSLVLLNIVTGGVSF